VSALPDGVLPLGSLYPSIARKPIPIRLYERPILGILEGLLRGDIVNGSFGGSRSFRGGGKHREGKT
jgi:hypothetical protein